MGQPGIAMTLYTVREPAQQDLAGTLEKVRKCGFTYVQWSGMPVLSASAIRNTLDQAGLQLIAAHCAPEPFEQDAARNIAYWREAGTNELAVGGMMHECMGCLADWLRGAARLESIGQTLRAAGMRFSYHNHAHEFDRFDGDNRRKLDILMEATKPENLYLELDVCWAQAGGVVPAEYLLRYAQRCPVIHVKDMKSRPHKAGHPNFAPLGEGVLDWDSIFGAARQTGVEWCVYEQDTVEGDLFDAVKKSYEFLAGNL